MIYTRFGAKVVKIKKYVTTDEKIREEIDGQFAEVEIDYEDGKSPVNKLLSVSSLQADNGLVEIYKAMKFKV